MVKRKNFYHAGQYIIQKMKKEKMRGKKINWFLNMSKEITQLPGANRKLQSIVRIVGNVFFVNNAIRSTILERDTNSSEFKWTQQPYAQVVDGDWASLTLSLKLKAPSEAVQLRVCDVLPWGLECVKVTKVPEPLSRTIEKLLLSFSFTLNPRASK